MKGVTQTLWIVVAAIVIIVVALIMIQVFGGGLGKFLDIFNPWAQGTGDLALCQSKCSTLCVGQPSGSTPSGWSSANIDGRPCSKITTCTCGGIGGCIQSGGGCTLGISTCCDGKTCIDGTCQ